MSHGMPEEKIRACAIDISMRTFEIITKTMLMDDVVNKTTIKIPEDPFTFADNIAEYIRTGKHPEVSFRNLLVD